MCRLTWPHNDPEKWGLPHLTSEENSLGVLSVVMKGHSWVWSLGLFDSFLCTPAPRRQASSPLCREGDPV